MGDIVYSIFTSHGPDLLSRGRDLFDTFMNEEGEAVDSLIRAGETLNSREPDTIIAISPHWNSVSGFKINGQPRLQCIQDYFGFPGYFYDFRYDAVGDPELAELLASEAKAHSFNASLTDDHGLDHGHWVPLYYLSPKARIPVVPLSLASESSADHIMWGRIIGEAIRKSSKDVAIVATGALLHRLDLIADFGENQPWPDGERFLELARLAFTRWNIETLMEDRSLFRSVAPEGRLGSLLILYGALGGMDVDPRVLTMYRVATYTSNNIVEITPKK
ncbi:MAG: hypothetical protein JRN19_05585 [Nitrososphaerota archaeon]|nr:hypothetical protein [Nitrososphaerota archaeon]